MCWGVRDWGCVLRLVVVRLSVWETLIPGAGRDAGRWKRNDLAILSPSRRTAMPAIGGIRPLPRLAMAQRAEGNPRLAAGTTEYALLKPATHRVTGAVGLALDGNGTLAVVS